jgi:hypothetical protein
VGNVGVGFLAFGFRARFGTKAQALRCKGFFGIKALRIGLVAGAQSADSGNMNVLVAPAANEWQGLREMLDILLADKGLQ